MKVSIVTRSPVHIGSGESYSASEFIQSKAKLNGKIEKTIKRIDISKYFLSLDNQRQNDLINKLSRRQFKLSSLNDNNLKNYGSYTSINKCYEFNQDKSIVEMIKTLNHIYIPGSSIKGAIKTALLYNSLTRDDIFQLKNPKRINGIIKRKFSSPQANNPPQGDIMRFLQVSDSSVRKIPYIYDVYSIMASSKGGKNYYEDRLDKLNYLETITEDAKLTFDMNNNYNENVHGQLHYREEQKHLIDLENIKNSIFKFSKDIIDNEINFSIKYDVDNLLDYYSKLEKRNSVDNPLLKIGSGSGFLTTTVGLKVKNQDRQLYENIRRSIGTTTYSFEFPKSRKITRDKGMPLGWVQLNFEE